MKTLDFKSGMSFGLGYNPLSQAVRGAAVTWKDIEKTSETQCTDDGSASSPNRTYIVSKLAENSQELSKVLDVSLTTSLGLPGMSLSAKGKYVSASKLDLHSLCFVIRITVTNEIFTLKDPALSPKAMNMLERNGVDRFCRAYGQEFISGFIMGGEYFACLEIKSKRQQSKKTMMGEIGANLPVFNLQAGGKVNASNSFDSLNKDYTFNLVSYQSGGNGMRFPLSFEEVVAEIQNFMDTVDRHNVHYATILSDYDSLGIPNLHMSISGDLDLCQNQLEQLSARRLQYLQYLDLIPGCLSKSIASQNNDEIMELQECEPELRKAVEELMRSAQNIVNNPNGNVLSDDVFKPVKIPSCLQHCEDFN
jgi:hypothetical protein